MYISLYLKRAEATSETSIFARISYSCNKLKYYFPEKINPHGNYYRNLHSIIEHTYYHLGQISLIKKILNEAKAAN